MCNGACSYRIVVAVRSCRSHMSGKNDCDYAFNNRAKIVFTKEGDRHDDDIFPTELARVGTDEGSAIAVPKY